MKLEIQRWRDELVRVLFERELDVQPNALAARFMSAQVGGFHDPGASPRGDDETVPARRDVDRPFR